MPMLPPNISIYPKNIFKGGNGIFFLETTDRMEPPSLVLCAIESAARVYHDRPIGFFMKGLHDIETEEDINRTRNLFPTLSSFHNVHILPLRFEELFNNTPLQSWYEKVKPQKEVYWIHVLSDACRLAIIWTFGGIYMDTDIISTQPIPSDHFFAPQSTDIFSNGVFGLPRIHSLAWEFMDSFVQNYRGEEWGHQGPALITRVLKHKCKNVEISLKENVTCGTLTFFVPDCFYPVPYHEWKKYFIQWDTFPTFNNSFGLHLWNFMNKNGKTMVPGSNTLVEHLYSKNCPCLYELERKKHEYQMLIASNQINKTNGDH
ncbi:alpha-1,4-N-acetylglucosaminyltransferase-like [Bufo bufo]|uniref:alpha-1,4-N-acetylglucosaminyltransferase-like n=1 Tax=Bufo bufo TaxID=8384 RepID=UPI001ABE72C5|nr:alpha-1,4-N-acetylglucosaminyltransferase-like [Bufo bufo]